jgi:hypothetical protein
MGKSNEIFDSLFSLNYLSCSQQTCLKANLNIVEILLSYSYVKYLKINSLLAIIAGSKKRSLGQPKFVAFSMSMVSSTQLA